MIQKSNSVITVDNHLLQQNFKTLSSFLDPDTRIMAVVKANAYGHGAVEIAQALDDKVGAFAVNAIQEGIELRENGITKPILVFEVPQQKMVPQYRIHNLTATISAREHFEWVPNGTSYHLNFDTGMGRLGFAWKEAPKIADIVEKRGELFCTGIYSHFATAHEPGSSLVQEQHQLFKKVRSYFPDNLATHIANTGGTAFYDTRQFNMVRLGIGLYGYAPGNIGIDGLKPILSWRSHIAQVKEVEKGKPISYGGEWKVPADGFVGIIPVGYSDGVARNLSGRIAVTINGKRYPAVGTVTMNYFMVYLRDDYYEVGTEVQLLGEKSNAYDWAQKTKSIPYEILTSLDDRIPREYV